MHSKITSKYQTTIPKEVRERLKLSVSDILEWKIEDGEIKVEPSKSPFKAHQGSIHIGPGNIADDIEQARKQSSKRFE